MAYAEISVNSPIAQRHTFSYSIPTDLIISIGQAVWVPFGSKILQGIVLDITSSPGFEETKDISGIIEPRLIVPQHYLTLARWISEHYLSPLFESVALMLPPSFERKPIAYIVLSKVGNTDLPSLSEEQQHVLELLRKDNIIYLSELEKKLGVRKANNLVTQMVNRKLIIKDYEIEAEKIRPRLLRFLSLSVDIDKARTESGSLRRKSPKQANLLDYLIELNLPSPASEVIKDSDSSPDAATELLSKGLIKVEFKEVNREPILYNSLQQSFPLTLTASQSLALSTIKELFISNQKSKVFLLHGVTGSGKTEVYLQALAETRKLGKRGIVLVSEISLTPQTIERFASRFPGKVAVLHSRLSPGEQYDEWRRIKAGEFDVVIGPRSAIFAPQPDLGLIVIDEEHEWTYKQDEQQPRYHARDVAIKLAELTGATVILGSATPDVETYYRSRRGEYSLLELPERVTPSEGSPLPEVKIVDLREELKSGNRGIYSRSLQKYVIDALEKQEQVILFLNRRGGATFVQCRSCGFIIRCKRCEVVMTYHPNQSSLVCHQCNYRMPVPQICPKCGSKRIKFLGIGTQKLEQEAGLSFPRARILRWDSDTASAKNAHQEFLEKFTQHQADLLIGTQMIAKGLDIPLVTVVGVVIADTSLNLPDFRSGERTFQLLCQVAGRAGRGIAGGQVIIQTYSPENYAVKAAAAQDYLSFYEKEIAYRRELKNPPFSQLVGMTFSHSNDSHCQQETERIRKLLLQERDSRGIADINIIGPAPAFIHRLRGKYRWQLVLRGTEPAVFLSEIPFPRGWTIDVDPVSLI